MKKNGIWILLLLIIIAAAVFFLNKKDKKSGTLEVAANLPMTGFLGTYGGSVRDGLNFGLEDLKDSLEKNKLKINIDFQDNLGEAKNAVSIFQKQAINKPDIYMSGITQQTMSIIDQVESKGFPHILWSFTPLFLDNHPKTFRSWVNFGVEIDKYKEYINYKKPKKVAILYVNIIGAQIQFNEHIVPWLAEKGIKDGNIFIESYDIPKTNFKDLAAKVKNFNPDVLLIEGFESNLVGIVKDFTSYSILDHTGNAMFAFDLLDCKEELDSKLLEGLYVTAPYFEYSDDTKISSWKKRFQQKFGRAPLYTDGYAYDLATVLYTSGLNHLNNKVEISDAIRVVEFEGISGHINFNKSGELNYALSICQFQNGKLNPVVLK